MSAVLTPFEDVPDDRYSPNDRQVAQLRIPPHSIESESSVLGSLLLDNRAWDRVGDLLTGDDFYRFEHRLIFDAIGGLINANKPADIITVFEVLRSIDKARELPGGLQYLNQLAQFVSSAANVRRYAEVVRERSILRKLISASDEIATAAFNTQGKEVAELLDTAMQRVMAISPDAVTDDWVSMASLVVEQLDRIQELADNPDAERGQEFTPTGLPNLDDILDGGLRGGQFIVIGARPGMGKTAIADGIGRHIAMHEGKPVAKFSMEMQNSEGAQRAISDIGTIPLHALRRPSKMLDSDWSSLTESVEKLRNAPWYTTDKPGLNINQVRTRARALARKVGKLGLVIVDYFQLMSGVDPRQQRSAQLEEASRGLKNLAKELDCPVIALAQINRSVEGEGDSWEKQKPRFKDLKDCGSLEQDADVILFLVRPTIAQKTLDAEWKPYAYGDLAKQRGGNTGDLHFHWQGAYTRYAAWADPSTRPTSKTTGKKSL